MGERRLSCNRNHFLKTGQDTLSQTHLRQGKQECKSRLGSLISIDAIYMQPVAAPACFRRVEFQAEVVPAQKPIKCALRVFVPPEVRCSAIGFETGRDSCLSLNGLLIEIRADAPTPVESVAANGPKMPLFGRLQFGQPA